MGASVGGRCGRWGLRPAASPAACPGKFTCNTGRCIGSKLRCDGWADCADYSDELNCSESGLRTRPSAPAVPGPASCPPGRWGGCLCADIKPLSSLCCMEALPSVGAGGSVSVALRLVSIACKAGAQQASLQTGEGSPGSRAFPGSRERPVMAEGRLRSQLSYHSPLSDCNATYQFTCKNKFCKPLFWVCDTVNDCGDNSDELECRECL